MSPHGLICRRKCNWVGVSVEPKHHSHFTMAFFVVVVVAFLPHPQILSPLRLNLQSEVKLLGPNLHFPCLKWILGINHLTHPYTLEIPQIEPLDAIPGLLQLETSPHFRQTASNDKNTDKTDFNEKATKQQLRQKWSWYWSANTLLFRFNVYVFRILHNVP